MDWNAVLNHEDEGYKLYYECPVCGKVQSEKIMNSPAPMRLSSLRDMFIGRQSTCSECRSTLVVSYAEPDSTAHRSRWFMSCIRKYTLLNWLKDGFGDDNE